MGWRNFFKSTLKEIINENRNLFNRDVTKNWRRLLFFRSKKNCPSMLKTNQVTTVYVWKKHASMTCFIWAKCLFIFFCLLRISLNGKCQTKNYSCKNALRFRWQFQCDLILVGKVKEMNYEFNLFPCDHKKTNL